MHIIKLQNIHTFYIESYNPESYRNPSTYNCQIVYVYIYIYIYNTRRRQGDIDQDSTTSSLNFPVSSRFLRMLVFPKATLGVRYPLPLRGEREAGGANKGRNWREKSRQTDRQTHNTVNMIIYTGDGNLFYLENVFDDLCKVFVCMVAYKIHNKYYITLTKESSKNKAERERGAIKLRERERGGGL